MYNNTDKPSTHYHYLYELIAKVIHGDDYVNYDDFVSDRTKKQGINGEPIADTDLYTKEMLEKFDRKCEYCINSTLDVCRLRCKECFIRLFNPVPALLHSYCYNKFSDNCWKDFNEDKVREYVELFKKEVLKNEENI